MSNFGRELLACAVEGTDPEENPLRHVADLARSAASDWCDHGAVIPRSWNARTTSGSAQCGHA